jgi:hypothetical protein
LFDEVDIAYQAMRKLVIDRLPPCTPLVASSLSAVQQRAVDRFGVAEHELAVYRSALSATCFPELASTA